MTDTLLDYSVKARAPSAPKGWEPGIDWDGSKGTITTGGMTDDADPAVWANLIADWGLDPECTQIVDGSIQVRAWDANLGGGAVQRMKYYRASIVRRRSEDDRIDVGALCKSIERKKPVKKPSIFDADRALVALLSDWQIGKGEGGGSLMTIDRIEVCIFALADHIRELRKAGRPVSELFLIGLGDTIEQCRAFYAMQAFQADLDRRSQCRVARRLILLAIDTLLPLVDRIIVGAVPGNHGENRNSAGKAFTSWTDNDDLAVFETVAEICAANPERYKDVHFPTGAIADDLTMTLNIAGVPCGFAHGHQMRSGAGGAQGKVETWWKGQALGNQKVAEAQLLFTGHLHHFVCSEATGRTFFQSPALDGGSYWFTATSGQSSPAGMLVVGVGTAYGPRGWGDLAIL